MKGPDTVLVVGAGLAGSRVAETLRDEGFDGRVLVVGDESHPPYERPALSKEVLAGRRDPGSLVLRSVGRFDELEIELRTRTAAVRLEPGRAVLSDGSEVGWSALVLATGSAARRLPAPAPAGVHVVRTLEDALGLRRELGPGRRLAVAGAGLVGCEVATTASRLGADVTLIDRGLPLERLVGREGAELLAERHRAEGVTLRTGGAATGFTHGAGGRVSSVLLDDGGRVGCDAAVVSIGCRPSSELLGVHGGVPTDACGRTGLPAIYAAGDVALAPNPWTSRPASAGHWTAAAGLATAAARAVLGEHAPYEAPPSWWSDQAGLRLQFVGAPDGWATSEIDGGTTSFAVRYLDASGAVVAGLFANRAADYAALRRELARGLTAAAA
jgi:3-phenylpropionate/trans-cinnamate dioxygenase ferredoxin reductase subunit